MRESKTSNSCLHVHTYRPIRARLVDQVFYELKKKRIGKARKHSYCQILIMNSSCNNYFSYIYFVPSLC